MHLLSKRRRGGERGIVVVGEFKYGVNLWGSGGSVMGELMLA